MPDYKVGVSIALANGVSPVLAIIALAVFGVFDMSLARASACTP